ncbi:MAG TPA: glycosyltransferase family 39 protein [Sedimentisphaerales bacterium]|nr:glycosyltransferase family 39 protein [Sedimentisphaerales bacterium]
MATLEAKYKEHKDDVINLLILILIASVLGVYLIATTVLIAKDGVYYIERAQKLSSDPVGIIKGHPPGYPFLIFIAHRFVTLFTDNSSVFIWIYTAQSVTLLCRLIALIPLYFIGKFLVGSKRSFWAILILIILPYPAEFGSDALRDWPHILFLSTGLLFLIWGSRFGKWWMFAIAGLAAGLGHTIREECTQIVIYGILWLLISLFLPRGNISRLKAIRLTLILLIGFAIPAAPYMKVRGRVLPPKLKRVISCNTPWQSSGLEQSGFDDTVAVYTASGMPTDILKALGQLGEKISDNLMHFFILPLAVGLYQHFRKLRRTLLTERFFILALMILYLAMMVMLHKHYGYISRRHCMPMVVFTVFYIPVGLQIIARWLSKRASKSSLSIKRNRQRWFFILVAVGFSICTAKFDRITPLGWKMQGYIDTAKWLKENTSEKDLIAMADSRIGFYAQRSSRRMDGEKIPGNTTYVVKFLDGKQAEDGITFNREVRKRYSVWMNKKKTKKRIVIYEVL